MRNARISRIIEGTSEIMQLFIAREAMDTHVSRVMPIMMPKPGAKRTKGQAIVSALKFYAAWYPKTWMPARSDFGTKHLSGANVNHLKYIADTSKRLARTMFHTMAKFGPKLEYEQLVLASFVDIGTDLFAMSASLARAESVLAKNPGDEDLQNLVDYFCWSARERIARNFAHVAKNHNRLLNKVSRAYAEGKFAWMDDAIYKGTPTHFEDSAPARVTVDIPQDEQVPK
ncbi:MAG: acyl-CoA dehydrogenase [Candidatus Hydrogenedentes bacterium]|nr:acyl-CoA dehydrogenase [Candidatus Hydrogenedentota bacterium]